MIQFPLFAPASTWAPPKDLPSWAGAKRVAIDIESRDEQIKKLGPMVGRRKDAYVVGVSYAIEDGPSGYLPIRHLGGDNMDEGVVLRYLRDQGASFDGDLVGANISYDIDGLESDGVVFPKVRFFRDVEIADPLICELHDRYNLNAIAARWGLEGKAETLLNVAARDFKLSDPKRDLWKLPARFVGGYGEQDVRLPLQLLRRQEREIEEQDLWRVYDLESRLIPILTQMRRRGVRVHTGRLDQIEQWSIREEATALAEVRRLTGVAIAVGSVNRAEVIAPALRAIGYEPRLTPTGKLNIDKFVLASLKHPVATLIERARKVNKLRTTFVGSVRDHMTGDGRVHCTYNQLRKQKDEDSDETEGAAYGRLSCCHPNLQQQPSRDDFAAAWRAIYLPEEGEQWAACDFSQQEPRMAIHYACLSHHLIGHSAWLTALAARDKYRSDPSTDNHQMMADMAHCKRKDAKEIYLGLSYGMGGAKLCRKLGLPTRVVVRGKLGVLFEVNTEEGRALLKEGARRFEAAGVEGQALLDKFDAAVPFVRKLAQACERRAKEVGYITTLSGRRCRFPKDPSGNYDWTHKGLNRLIQGSSADQMKMGMVALWDAGFRVLIQVHDEVGNSVRSEEEAKAASQVMLDACPLELPSKVDIEMGESWGGSMGWREEA